MSGFNVDVTQLSYPRAHSFLLHPVFALGVDRIALGRKKRFGFVDE